MDITVETSEPITAEMLESVASIGGNAAGTVGRHRLETILSIDADKPSAAIDGAFRRLRMAGSIIAVDVMMEAEADRRLAEPMSSFERARDA